MSGNHTPLKSAFRQFGASGKGPVGNFFAGTGINTRIQTSPENKENETQKRI